MPKDSGVIWSRCLPMQGSSLGRWKSRMSRRLKDCHRQSRSIRSQRTAIPRSTVGTVTEIYDYLRLLWARVGTPHCPKCGKEIRQQSIDQIIDQILSLPEGTRIQVLAPVIRGKKGSTPRCWKTPGSPATSAAGWTGSSMSSPRTSPWRRTRSTTSRSWWTGW